MSKGEKIIIDTGAIPIKRMEQVLNARYDHEIDTEIELDVVKEKLPTTSQCKVLSDIAIRSYGKLKELDSITQTVIKDQTKTVGAKIIAKRDLSEPIIERFNKDLSALGKQVFNEVATISQNLFSNSMDLSSTEEQMSSIFATMIKDGKADIGLLATATKAESRIALNIAKNFPSLIPNDGSDNSYEALARMADHSFSPETRDHLDGLHEMNETIRGIATRLTRKKNNYLDRDILSALEENIAGSK